LDFAVGSVQDAPNFWVLEISRFYSQIILVVKDIAVRFDQIAPSSHHFLIELPFFKGESKHLSRAYLQQTNKETKIFAI